MIDERGLSILPISSLGLDYPILSERVPSGIKELDQMLGDAGYFRGSSVLVSGTAGTGKSSFAAAFAYGACRRAERVLYLAFEEPAAQIVRNMASIGYSLEKWVKKGLLRFHSVRSTLYGLEQHLVAIHKLVDDHKPQAVIFDPITNFRVMGDQGEVKSMLTRVIDYIKGKGITTLFTNLTPGGANAEQTEAEVSSLMDTWLVLRNLESGGDCQRLVRILKSRGTAHTSQVRGFEFTPKGIKITRTVCSVGEK
jgi:circadian clock protein KaiC